MRKLALTVLVLSTLIYPFLVFFSLNRFDPRWLLMALAGSWILRTAWYGQGMLGWGPGLLAVILFLWGREGSVLLYPVLVNAFFLLWFAFSLRFPPPVVERLARFMDPDLPPEGVRYTRAVTWVWCGFFLLNGTLAAMTVAIGNVELWVWYNGLIAYLLMGGLVVAEYWVRRRKMRLNGHA